MGKDWDKIARAFERANGNKLLKAQEKWEKLLGQAQTSDIENTRANIRSMMKNAKSTSPDPMCGQQPLLRTVFQTVFAK